MARRISRPAGFSQSQGPKQRKSRGAQKRSLNAFAIAGEAVEDDVRIPSHRLGQLEDDERHHKRRRIGEDDEDSDENEPRNRRADSISGGEDSDGNTWKMGHVSEDDDSEIDSDEAFGESDEERFADFTFRASSSHRKTPKKQVKDAEDVNLDEDDVDMDSDGDESSLGEDAVDLATMLDNYEEGTEGDDESGGSEGSDLEGSDDGSASEEDSEDSEEESDNEEGEERITQLHDLISSIQPQEAAKTKQSRGVDRYEGMPMSAYGITADKKLTIDDLLPTISDPAMRKSLKSVAKDKPAKGALGKLAAPLPKRQQDKLDRVAANEKAKETLDRWVETVKHHRRAEHIQFPIRDPNASEPMGKTKMLPTTSSIPLTELESTVQNILRESRLMSGNGKGEEEAIKQFEEIQEKKMSVDEVLAARAELRKQRDLLFREEIKAKRLKKIKSKSFRRVHRKDRERAAQQEQDALAAAGLYDSEEDREKHDRQRAEERMGAKHRESKWAKAMKQSGRTVWDEDARGGIVEMARRNEELRRRIEGKEVHGEDSDIGSEFDDNDDDDSSEDEATARKKIDSALSRLEALDREAQEKSKLGALKFMQKAEAARKAENDAAMEDLRKELNGEVDSSDSDAENPSTGRMKFGPAPTDTPAVMLKSQRTEFEEPDESDHNKAQADEDDIEIITEKPQKNSARSRVLSSARGKSRGQTLVEEVVEENPWAPTAAPAKITKSKASASAEQTGPQVEVLLPTESETKPNASNRGSRPAKSAGKAEILLTVDADPSDSDDDGLTDAMKRNQALVQQAFAGTDLAEDFAKEKQTIVADEDDKVVDNTLPGWGSWAGDGVSRREKRRAKGRFLTKVEGIRPEARKDAKLKNVIMNEKRVKRNAAYLASTLPFPFNSKDEYERSIRMPMGKEWSMDKPKPRILVKPGQVIAPLEKPLL